MRRLADRTIRGRSRRRTVALADGEQLERSDRVLGYGIIPRKIEPIAFRDRGFCAHHSNSRKTKNATANEITPDSATETILVFRDIDESIMNHIPTATTVATISALDEFPTIVVVRVVIRVS